MSWIFSRAISASTNLGVWIIKRFTLFAGVEYIDVYIHRVYIERRTRSKWLLIHLCLVFCALYGSQNKSLKNYFANVLQRDSKGFPKPTVKINVYDVTAPDR